MRTISFDIKKNDELDRLCRVSNNLYNQTLYQCKESYKKDSKYLNYNDLDKLMKTLPNLDGEINYRLLPVHCSQHILKLLDKNYKSFFESTKDYKSNPNKYKNAPHPPEFRKKGGKFILIFTNQQAKIKDGYIQFKKGFYIRIPQYEKYKNEIDNFQQIRVLPLINGEYKICIIYKNALKTPLTEYGNIASIDIGIDNMVTMISNVDKPLIVNGKNLKSKSKYYFDKIAFYQSELKKNKTKTNKCGKILTVCPHTSKMTRLLYNNKSNYIKDGMHKISRYVVNYLIENKITKLYIGYNEGWKQNVNMGKKNNQIFVSIPYAEMIRMIKYKAEEVGIEVVTHEESYTSKCDGLAFEDIKSHDVYLGKRKHRGLFQSSTGRLINADVNGALNILRKNISDNDLITNLISKGCLYQPVKFNVI